jgi:hypothetical protein
MFDAEVLWRYQVLQVAPPFLVNHWLLFDTRTLLEFFTTGIIPNRSMRGWANRQGELLSSKNLVADVDFSHSDSTN